MVLAAFFVGDGLAAASPLGDVTFSTNSARNADTMDSMFFSTKTGWFLQIFSDGSGNLQFGSSGFDNAKFPAGSFDFAEVMKSLASHSTPGSDDRAISVSICSRGKDAGAPQTVKTDLGLSIFRRAVGVAKAYDVERFEDLKKGHPFVVR